MARGMGAEYKTKKCICENQDISNWSIVRKTKVKSGTQLGKIKAIVYCNKCGCQWETSAKYIENIEK